MFSKLNRDNCLQLNTRTYNTAINGLCRQGFVDEAYELFRKMEKDPLEAMDLIHEMVSKGFSADARTMTLLIELVPKNQLDHPIFQKLLRGPDIKSHKIGSSGLSAAAAAAAATQGTC
ncbi:unnamed protein product [Linum tenue]|uniref:Pentatricopeptide repeat-containing protein n=1 Tax=Linum tenue TaxID=586396 RepID=A0AAV0S8M0_9ROSI|nr:unnamed protein product [Linum tenue]